MPSSYDLVCLSHLRWNFVYQRPHHLLSRFARNRRVFFVEEPLALPASESQARLDISQPQPGLNVVVPRIPRWGEASAAARDALVNTLMHQLFANAAIRDCVLWYYTPLAIGFTRDLPAPLATVYDCMDELSAFKDAAPDLLLHEAELLGWVDLVFTGGHMLYEAKRGLHQHVHAFPSGVDVSHFAQARRPQPDPVDQAALPHPRLGFCGVLDERLDSDLVMNTADLQPEWQFVFVGPVAKIDVASLPRRSNIHYLGAKSYAELPAYLAGWDVALIPFARNASTRFISPTKTPEYLAAGRPVVSTSIRDVVRPYHDAGLTRIADTPEEFVHAAEAAMREDACERQVRVDEFLHTMSWERTWSAMDKLVGDAIERRRLRSSVALAYTAPEEVAAASVEDPRPAGEPNTRSSAANWFSSHAVRTELLAGMEGK